MARKRLYHTAAEKKEANRLKSARYYARNRADINAKRRKGPGNSLKSQQIPQELAQADSGPSSSKEETTRGNSLKSQEADSGPPSSREETTRGNSLKPQQIPQELAQVDSGPPSLREETTRASSLNPVGATALNSQESSIQAKRRLQSPSEEQAQNSSADEAQPDCLDTIQRSPTNEKARKKHHKTPTALQRFETAANIEDFETANWVDPDKPNPDLSSVGPEKDEYPMWFREVQGHRASLCALYSSVGAAKRREFLAKLYHAHVRNYRDNDRLDLLHEKHDILAEMEHRLQELVHKVWFRCGNSSHVKRYCQSLLDRTTQLRVDIGTMIIINTCGTEDLIDDYEQRRLPFQRGLLI